MVVIVEYSTNKICSVIFFVTKKRVIQKMVPPMPLEKERMKYNGGMARAINAKGWPLLGCRI